MSNQQPRIQPLGCAALIIRFGQHIDRQITAIIRHLSEQITALNIDGLRDQVPAYTTLTLHFDLGLINYRQLRLKVEPLLNDLKEPAQLTGRQVSIPVWYHPEVGPDLQRIADHHQITIDEVIARHSQQIYQVYAIGFAPGFAYLGDVADNLATPRLATPRPQVPAGAVAIADRQTAVYPLSTPGGWNIVGRTAMPMFDRDLPGLCPLQIGDHVQFEPVSRAAFIEAGGEQDG